MNLNYQRKRPAARKPRPAERKTPAPVNDHLQHDITLFFKELFTDHPEHGHADYTPVILSQDMGARFGTAFKIKELRMHCKANYDQVQPGMFRIFKSAFFREREGTK